MTIEEKRNAIKEYCDDHTSCSMCLLDGCPKKHDGCFSCEDKYIDEHYEILFGKLEVKVKDAIKPNYYNDSKITPFNVIDDWNLDFYLGNAVKYIKRAGKKEGNSRLQDLKKIREYIDQEIRLEEARE